MDKPPTEPERSAKPQDAPEELDPKLRHIVIGAAEACRERFDESPSHDAYQLAAILDALGRHRHLIDPVFREIGRHRRKGRAVVTAIGDVRIARVAMKRDPQSGEDVPVEDEDGLLVYQRIGKGRRWEGPSMVRAAAWAIDTFDDPLDVATAIIAKLPPLMRADCRSANRDPEQVGLAIAKLLVDDGYWRALGRPAPPLPKKWRDPQAVLLAVLRELGHPRPENVTRAC